MKHDYDTFESIIKELERFAFRPSPEACRRLFNPEERGWLKACCHWIEQKEQLVPHEVYPDIERIADDDFAERQEVARLHLLCTQMAVYARQLCEDTNIDRSDIADRLFVAAFKALTDQEVNLNAFLEQIEEISHNSTSEQPESIVFTVLSLVAENDLEDTRKPASSSWHLRRVGWLYDLTVLLLGKPQNRKIMHQTHVPILLISENMEQEQERAFLAELEFQVLSDGRGEVFITPEQAFIQFKQGFDDIFDVALEAAQLAIDINGKKVNTDIRVKINYADRFDGSSRYEKAQQEPRLLDFDEIKGRSATAAAALGLYHALEDKIYDPRLVVLAEIDKDGTLGSVGQMDIKIQKALCSGVFDTIVMAGNANIPKQEESQENNGTHTKTAANLRELLSIRSHLIEEIESYLEGLVNRCTKLHRYYPSHLQQPRLGVTGFDRLRQITKFTLDRRDFHQTSIARKRDKGVPDKDLCEDDSLDAISWENKRSPQYERMVILGNPGSGKSWFLDYKAKQLAEYALERLEERKLSVHEFQLPILIRLSQFTETEATLEEGIVSLTAENRSDAFVKLIQQKLKSDKCHLLLDGWDEVSQHRTLQRKLEDFIDIICNLPSSPYLVLTSRFIGDGATLPHVPDATELMLLPFDWHQIESFVDVWFADDKTKVRSLLARIQQQPKVHSLTRIPLMLGMLCRICGDGSFPDTKEQLYERCIKGLLREWPKVDRKIQSTLIAQDIQTKSGVLEAIFEILSYISLEMLKYGSDEIGEPILIDTVEKHLRSLDELHELKKTQYKDVTAAELISFIRSRGILVPASESNNSSLMFLHRSFQEYLASRMITKLVSNNPAGSSGGPLTSVISEGSAITSQIVADTLKTLANQIATESTVEDTIGGLVRQLSSITFTHTRKLKIARVVAAVATGAALQDALIAMAHNKSSHIRNYAACQVYSLWYKDPTAGLRLLEELEDDLFYPIIKLPKLRLFLFFVAVSVIILCRHANDTQNVKHIADLVHGIFKKRRFNNPIVTKRLPQLLTTFMRGGTDDSNPVNLRELSYTKKDFKRNERLRGAAVEYISFLNQEKPNWDRQRELIEILLQESPKNNFCHIIHALVQAYRAYTDFEGAISLEMEIGETTKSDMWVLGAQHVALWLSSHQDSISHEMAKKLQAFQQRTLKKQIYSFVCLSPRHRYFNWMLFAHSVVLHHMAEHAISFELRKLFDQLYRDKKKEGIYAFCRGVEIVGTEIVTPGHNAASISLDMIEHILNTYPRLSTDNVKVLARALMRMRFTQPDGVQQVLDSLVDEGHRNIILRMQSKSSFYKYLFTLVGQQGEGFYHYAMGNAPWRKTFVDVFEHFINGASLNSSITYAVNSLIGLTSDIPNDVDTQ